MFEEKLDRSYYIFSGWFIYLHEALLLVARELLYRVWLINIFLLSKAGAGYCVVHCVWAQKQKTKQSKESLHDTWKFADG